MVVALLGFWLLSGCSDLQPVKLGMCGNRVVEAGEDCDGGRQCNRACHLDCDATRACPDGWGCDLGAEVCRVASGSFRRQTLEDGGLAEAVARDFDGDGRDDLLLTSWFGATSLRYFDENGQTVRHERLPRALQAGAADMTGDGLPDLVLVGDRAVFAYQAKRSRVLTPLISAVRGLTESAQLLSLDTNCDGVRDFVLLEENQLSSVDETGATRPLVPTAISAQALGDMEEAGTGLRTLRAIGSYSADGVARCGLLALPASASKIDIYGASSPAPSQVTFGRLATVALPEFRGEALLRLFLVDLNGDAKEDLLVSASSATWTSYGVGDGTFHSDPARLPPLLSGKADNLAVLSGTDTVLAAGPGKDTPVLFTSVNYVDARILRSSLEGTSLVAAVSRVGGPSPSALDPRSVDIVRILSGNLANTITLPTSGIPGIQDVADFDGDGVDDLLLAEAAAADKPQTLVSVLFPPVTGDSSGPTPLAELTDIRQLAGGQFAARNALRGDGVADIGVVSGASNGALSLGFLHSGTDRVLRSSVPIEDPQEVTYGLVALGRFRDASHTDLALLGSTPTTLTPDGSFSESRARISRYAVDAMGTSKLDSAEASLDLSATVAVGVADLDGDSIDEMYLLAPRDNPNDAPNASVGVYGLRYADKQLRVDEVATTGESLVGLWVGDANGDGRSDVVTADPGAGNVVVVLAGTPSSTRVHRLSVARLNCAGGPIGAAFLQADADASPELAVNCVEAADQVGASVRLTVADVDWSKDEVTQLSAAESTVSYGLATGDFNGDGVDDLAVNGEQGVVFFGAPRQ